MATIKFGKQCDGCGIRHANYDVEDIAYCNFCGRDLCDKCGADKSFGDHNLIETADGYRTRDCEGG